MSKVFTESTKVPLERTMALIQAMLSAHGAEAIVIEYQDSQPNALAFRIPISGQPIAFLLPCRWRSILALLRYKSYSRDDEARARRIAWRQVYWWLKAQFAMIDTEMVQLTEVFLPYAQYMTGETVFDRLTKNGFQQLTHQPGGSNVQQPRPGT